MPAGALGLALAAALLHALWNLLLARSRDVLGSLARLSGGTRRRALVRPRRRDCGWTYVVIAVILAGIVLRERLTRARVAGAAAVAVGVASLSQS